MLPQPLAALGQHRQFILYRAVPSSSRPGKTDKFPCSSLTGEVINAHDPSYWVDHTVAFALAPFFGPEYGVGFVLTNNTGLFCLDIDDCLVNGAWSKDALDLCAAFPGAAVEVSRSGTGLHIWGSGAIPPHGCKNTVLGLELYHEGRFIALGLPNAVGNAATDCTSALSKIVPRYFPTSPISAMSSEWTTSPSPEWCGPADDDELLRRIFAAKPSTATVFGGKATFAQLWNADVAALTASYPSASSSQAYGESEADAALCSHLAWWTGRDMERIRRLMQRSALKRDKWERDYYIQRTIMRACAACATVYKERPTDLPGQSPVTTDDAEPVTHAAEYAGRHVNGSVFITADKQLEMWKGYTYVTDANIILTATGQQLGPEQFKNRYGGSVFNMDTANNKTTTNAWEAFTHSQAVRMPKVDHMSFRPDVSPSGIWEKDGESFVNSYRKLTIARVKGDVTPFLTHLAKVLPNKRDQSILLAYMAAIVQHQGIKFQWAPLIQGMQGNGKSLFSRCVAEAVGMRYTHMPRASELTEKFNDWLVGKVFIGVEDVWYPDGRTEIIETLKPMITNSRQPIRAMRQSERVMDICANFIVNSNHKDGIRKTADDRRWCVMYCAQQEMEDMVRDGMTGDYFTSLYGWLNTGGYAMVTDYLYTYAIPAEFGLDCLLSRAPTTSSTEEAIAVSLGRVEQEVFEAISSGAAGFAGGWVSSLALDAMLKEQRMDLAMPRAKRREMMKTLGYTHHPAFRDGRCTAVLPGTSSRPILYIKQGHWSTGLTTGAEVMKAYIAAQMPGAIEMGVVGRVGT
jgi:primase-polymerase (primpol)-like protein